jgi:hypothetical protein
MVIVKNEDGANRNRVPSTGQHPSAKTQQPKSTSNGSRLDASTIASNWTTDIEMPPPFVPILERMKALNLGLLQQRHFDFVRVETNVPLEPVQEAEQVKLYDTYLLFS